MVRDTEHSFVGSWLLIFTFKINWFRLSALLFYCRPGQLSHYPPWLGLAWLAENFPIAIIVWDYFSFDRPCTALAVTASGCCVAAAIVINIASAFLDSTTRKIASRMKCDGVERHKQFSHSNIMSGYFKRFGNFISTEMLKITAWLRE